MLLKQYAYIYPGELAIQIQKPYHLYTHQNSYHLVHMLTIISHVYMSKNLSLVYILTILSHV